MTDPDDDDRIAAEYVLGTLDASERAAAARRRQTDTAFNEIISAWEARLQPLSEAGSEEAPPSSVWLAIVDQLNLHQGSEARAARSSSEVIRLRRAVRRWKAATATAAAFAACLLAWVAVRIDHDIRRPGPMMVAFLQSPKDAPAYVLKADLRGRRFLVEPVAASPPQGKALELWVIDAAIGAPRSLGVLEAGTEMHPMPPTLSSDVLSRATYAVTEEPPGGSPTGAPSGPPIMVGHLISSAL